MWNAVVMQVIYASYLCIQSLEKKVCNKSKGKGITMVQQEIVLGTTVS